MARRRARQEQDKTAEALSQSLESTCRGLATLLESLDRSGLPQAIEAYREMERVLELQRGWSLTHRRVELNPLWHRLAETAAAIHAILGEFDVVMHDLSDIELLGRSQPTPQPTGPQPHDRATAPSADTDEVLRLMLARARMSTIRLRRELIQPSSDASAAVETLLVAGVVQRNGWGRGRSYGLSPAAQRRVLEELVRPARRSGSDGSLPTPPRRSHVASARREARRLRPQAASEQKARS